MPHAIRWTLALTGLVLFLAGCAKTDEPAATDADGALTIAVIPKATMHVYWKSVHAGARRAEADLEGVRILWQGPAREDDRADQVALVETFIQKRVDGLVLAPLDEKALVGPVRRAREAGIPVVIIDSALADADAAVSFVATDNYQGGVMAGRHLARLLDGKGRVIVLRYLVGSASNVKREEGFLAEMARHPGIEVASSDQHGGPTVETAMAAAEALLAKFGPGQVDGIFCPNEPMAWGMLRALDAAGRAGTVRLVAFDTSDRLLAAMKKGHLDALVLQDPVQMGYEGVRTVVAHLRGREVPKRIDTGVTLARPENLSDPDVHRLVHPAVE
ncbi:MAG: substrate-binding domain-containing protein [Planctomycetota bacterium]|nr:substrate-binding domain-containing protein [Planctomycetota bacterium]